MVRRAIYVFITGAALMFFLDPESGRKRRHEAVEKINSLVLHFERNMIRTNHFIASQVYGYQQKFAHLRISSEPELNNEKLVQRVRSEVFRTPHFPKGRVEVTAENAVVTLKGHVDRYDQIKAIENAVRTVPGVSDVRNYLQVIGQPAASGTTR